MEFSVGKCGICGHDTTTLVNNMCCVCFYKYSRPESVLARLRKLEERVDRLERRGQLIG